MFDRVTYAQASTHAVSDGEKTRRQLMLLAIASMILLSTTPILGHHLISGLGSLAPSRDHVLRLCVVALQTLLSPVHDGFHLLLVAGLIYAGLDRLRASRELRNVLRSLPAARPQRGGVFARAAARVGVPVDSIRVVDGLPTPAFTAGWWHPRIFVAAQLATLLTEEQLGAVIRHEDAHARKRDPLKLSVMRFLALTLFYIPALRRIADDLADDAEIVADDRAAGAEPDALASAIVTLARFDACSARIRKLETSAVVSRLNNSGLLERRVRRLVGEAAPPRSHLTRSTLSWAAAALILVWISVPAAAPSAPYQGKRQTPASGNQPEHCRHYGFVFSHFVCPGGVGAVGAARCAHRYT